MVFSSTLFIFLFLPPTLLGYYLVRRNGRNYWLLFVSLIFFAWSQPKYFWVIIISILINYYGARMLAEDALQKYKKKIFRVTLVLNLALLFFFKYFSFTVNSIVHILGGNFTASDIILPVGISFFTFQGISYVIDVYRGHVPAQKNIIKVALYIVLFPQLVAGPIVRYTDIANEIDNRKSTLDDFSSGIERFIIGLGKKAIIANTMAAMVDKIWETGPEGITCAIAWVGSIAYTLQIYFDFSGYSDMAIGLGRMFGFHFNENFNLPYIAKNITDFWRRWHISLSSWFRDYVYIPLGGNRKHVYLNLALVFLLTGIWHGADWNFIFWGMWNGAFILIERLIKSKKNKKCASSNNRKSLFLTVLSKAYTLLIINFGWVLFRAPGTKEALHYIGVMIDIIKPERIGFTMFWYLDRFTITIMLVGIFFASSGPLRIVGFFKRHISEKWFIVVKYILRLMLLYISMLRIVSGTYNPFIYFQF